MASPTADEKSDSAKDTETQKLTPEDTTKATKRGGIFGDPIVEF